MTPQPLDLSKLFIVRNGDIAASRGKRPDFRKDDRVQVSHRCGEWGDVDNQGNHQNLGSVVRVANRPDDKGRWIVFVVMIPAVLYALAKLYRAIAIVHALVWHGSGRGSRTTAKGVGILGMAILIDLGLAEVVGWIRRHDQLGGISALVVYLVVVGGAWLVVSMQLPHRGVRWRALVPGALVVGAGLLFINVFNVYVTTRLVEDRANTYGALGIAAALLLSLVLVGRVIVVSAELNAALDDRQRTSHR